jgi:hypothetical protein
MASKLPYEASSGCLLVLPAADSMCPETSLALHLRHYLISEKENIQPIHENVMMTMNSSGVKKAHQKP